MQQNTVTEPITVIVEQFPQLAPSQNTDTNSYTIIDSKQLRHEIITGHIYPAYINEFTDALAWKRHWSKISSIAFTITFIVVSGSTLISFSAPQFPNVNYLSYLSGVVGLVAMASDRFAHFADGKSRENTNKVNILLKSIGIHDTFPDTSTHATEDTQTKTDNSAVTNTNQQIDAQIPHQK